MKDVKYQTVYKNVVWCDGYDNLEEAIECMEENISKYGMEEKFFSIEVQIERDTKRRNGQGNTRGTTEELCKEFMDEKYTNAMNKIKQIEKILKVVK